MWAPHLCGRLPPHSQGHQDMVCPSGQIAASTAPVMAAGGWVQNRPSGSVSLLSWPASLSRTFFLRYLRLSRPGREQATFPHQFPDVSWTSPKPVLLAGQVALDWHQ